MLLYENLSNTGSISCIAWPILFNASFLFYTFNFPYSSIIPSSNKYPILEAVSKKLIPLGSSLVLKNI